MAQIELIFLAILVSGVICTNPEKTAVDRDYAVAIQKARELVINYLNDTQNQFVPGLVIGVSVGGEQKWVEGFGLANIENNVTMKGESVMQIGSISKSFTASLAARLVQDGKLDFDVPISAYLTCDEFPEKTWNGTAVNITLRQLLQMTAGIPNGPTNLDLGKCLWCVNQKGRLVLMRDKELDFEPLTMYTYSNFGYELAGAVIESVLGNATFLDAMTEMIEIVLKLNKTAIANSQLITPNMASFYLTDMQNVYSSGMWGDILLNDVPAPGGITGTIADLLTYSQTWLDAYYGRSENFLDQSTAKVAWTPSDSSAAVYVPYGMGWVIQNVTGDRSSGGQVVWHNGATFGCRAILAIYPETEIIVAASVNLAQNSVDEFILEGIIADLFATNSSITKPQILNQKFSVAQILEKINCVHGAMRRV